jgi:hypothetical protein
MVDTDGIHLLKHVVQDRKLHPLEIVFCCVVRNILNIIYSENLYHLGYNAM